MALVAYDYESGSDNEEDEEEQNNTQSSVIIPQKPQTQENEEPSTLLTSQLPKPREKQQENVKDDQIEDFVPKYQPTKAEKPPAAPKKVKITIPSLSQFQDLDDDDEPMQKKAKINAKGSGLLSVLPPVKGAPLSNKTFVPNVLKNKPSTTKTNSLVPHAVRKKAEEAKRTKIKKILNPNESDDDGEDIELPETFDEAMWQKVCGRQTKKIEVIKEPEESTSYAPTIDIAPEPEKPYDGLDNEAFKELVGKSKKPVNIKLIDINEDQVLTDKDLWLTKSLTDPDQAPKVVIDEPVDPTRKKKHHITYLAQQAKENAQELESQWASSKFNRQQSRAKYGF